jgi:chromosome partitioning protein
MFVIMQLRASGVSGVWKGELMLVGVGNYKGGTAKTTTAVHLATFLQRLGPTLLVDGDGIRSATKWGQRGTGKGLPFKVISHAQMVAHIRDYEHVVIDTEGNPNDDDIRDLAASCDILVVPAVPESVATDGLTHTLEMLQKLGNNKYKVLLTMVPPAPRTEGKLLRKILEQENIPIFKSEIPRLAAFEKAAAEGVPVCDVKDDRNSARAWQTYEDVGKEMVNGRS